MFQAGFILHREVKPLEHNAHERSSKEGLTEWTCSYCPSIATTIRQCIPVCYHHASQLRAKVGLARRIVDHFQAELPAVWNVVFLEVDRLSRSGHVRLLYRKDGAYAVTLPHAA